MSFLATWQFANSGARKPPISYFVVTSKKGYETILGDEHIDHEHLHFGASVNVTYAESSTREKQGCVQPFAQPTGASLGSYFVCGMAVGMCGSGPLEGLPVCCEIGMDGWKGNYHDHPICRARPEPSYL